MNSITAPPPPPKKKKRRRRRRRRKRRRRKVPCNATNYPPVTLKWRKYRSLATPTRRLDINKVTCSKKATNSFPFRDLPCTIFGRIMLATSSFNCSLFLTYIGSSSPSFRSQSFVRWRWGCQFKFSTIRSAKVEILTKSICVRSWIYNTLMSQAVKTRIPPLQKKLIKLRY